MGFIPNTNCERYVIMISSTAKLIKCPKRASILVPMGIEFLIKYAWHSSQSWLTLLSFKNIHLNDFQVKVGIDGSKKFMYITSTKGCQKQILEKLPTLSSLLYYTTCCVEPVVQ